MLEQYKELNSACLESYKINEDLQYTNFEEYSRLYNIAEDSKNELNKYVHELYKDNDLMAELKQQHETIYVEMQERFNEFERENLERLQEMQKEVEK